MSEIKMAIRGLIVKIGLKKALIVRGVENARNKSVISNSYTHRCPVRQWRVNLRRFLNGFTGLIDRL